MKKIFYLLLFIFCILILNTPFVNAENNTITTKLIVTWKMTSVPIDLGGYKLLCTNNNSDIVTINKNDAEEINNDNNNITYK